MTITRRSILAGAAAAGLARPARAEGRIRLGLLHTLSPAPFYIAQQRGYFAESGSPVDFTFFEAAQPIADPSADIVAARVDEPGATFDTHTALTTRRGATSIAQ